MRCNGKAVCVLFLYTCAFLWVIDIDIDWSKEKPTGTVTGYGKLTTVIQRGTFVSVFNVLLVSSAQLQKLQSKYFAQGTAT